MEDRNGVNSVCHLCEKAFTSAGSLTKHHLTHMGERAHKCGTCEKAFTQAGSLKTHMLMHSGVKPHKCGTCEKAFTQAGHLKTYMLGKRTVRCIAIMKICRVHF